MHPPRLRGRVRSEVLLPRQVRRRLLGRDTPRDRRAQRMRGIKQDRAPKGRLQEQPRDHTRLGIVSILNLVFFASHIFLLACDARIFLRKNAIHNFSLVGVCGNYIFTQFVALKIFPTGFK